MAVARRFKHGVVRYDREKAYEGYTLFWQTGTKDAWLIDMLGRVVHRWRMPSNPGMDGVLLPNGNFLGSCQTVNYVEAGLPPGFSGLGGLLLEVDWDGNEVWRCDTPYMSHAFYPLDNGNIIYIYWGPDLRLQGDAAARVKGGLPGTEHNGKYIWGESLIEINRQGERVWEWRASEHLDPDIDVMCLLEYRTQWPYTNSVFVMPDGNVLVSMRFINTVAIVDKRSGDIVWRWGPGELGHQHDARMIDNGNILIFDNGAHRRTYGPSYSRVVEVNPKSNEIVWQYKANPPTDFYTATQGGEQRLPNGNTLICEALMGRLFEVTMEGELVWEFVNPIYGRQHHHGLVNSIFRAWRYGPDYPGLRGKELDPAKFYWTNEVYGRVVWNK